MKLIRVGADLAKTVFQVHGVERKEKAILRRRLTRENWLKVLLETVEPGCEIGMESCGGAHHWARRLRDIRAKRNAAHMLRPRHRVHTGALQPGERLRFLDHAQRWRHSS